MDEWIIDEFKKAGFSTAREVLSVNREELVNRVDVEEETVDMVLQILAAEFNDEAPYTEEDGEFAEEEPATEEATEETPATEEEAEENTQTGEQL